MFERHSDEELHFETRADVTAHITHDVLHNLTFMLVLYIVLTILAINLRDWTELRTLIQWMVTFAAYLYMGACIFPYLEQYTELDDRRATKELLMAVRANLTDDAFEQIASAVGGPRWESTSISDLNWTFDGAAFFSFTLMTTIGYGAFTPQTTSGKIFTVVYAPFGIAIAAVTYVRLADQVLSLVESIAFRLMRVDPLRIAFDTFDIDSSGVMNREEVTQMIESLGAKLNVADFDDLVRSAVEGSGGPPAGEAFLHTPDSERITFAGFDAALAQRPDLKKKVLNRSLEVYRWTFAFGLFALMLATSSLLNMWAEGWNGLDGIYFTMLTFTTIGLGDLTPSIDQFATWGLWFYLVGLGVTALVVSAMVDIVPTLGQAGANALWRVCRCGQKPPDGPSPPGSALGNGSRRSSVPSRAAQHGLTPEQRQAAEADARLADEALRLRRAELEERGQLVRDSAWDNAGRGGGVRPAAPTSFGMGGHLRLASAASPPSSPHRPGVEQLTDEHASSSFLDALEHAPSDANYARQML